jgi:hypothetical protein
MDNSDDFIFDTEIIAQGMTSSLKFQEVPISTRYFPEASSINFRRSVVYGLGVLFVLFQYWMHQSGWLRFKKLEPKRSTPAFAADSKSMAKNSATSGKGGGS